MERFLSAGVCLVVCAAALAAGLGQVPWEVFRAADADEHAQHWIKPFAELKSELVATRESLRGELSVLRDRILWLELRNGELEGKLDALQKEIKQWHGTPPDPTPRREQHRAQIGRANAGCQ